MTHLDVNAAMFFSLPWGFLLFKGHLGVHKISCPHAFPEAARLGYLQNWAAGKGAAIKPSDPV